MKKYWLILLLVFSPSLLFAWGVMGVSGGVVASGGSYLFSWNGTDCTSTNVQIGGVQGTLGSSNSGGTTSFPISGGQPGGYFDNEGTGAYYIRFPITSEDIVDFENIDLSFYMSCPAVPASRRVFSIVVDSNNYIVFICSDTGVVYISYQRGGSPNSSSTATGTIVSGTWQLLRLTISSTELHFYVDGIEKATDTSLVGTWAGTSGYIYFGADNTGGYNADIWIDASTIKKLVK